ncbi:MAG: hypothetical protein RLZZ519_2256 [Bacteroidota bacterium]|jgi:hypothetical protein
MAKYKSPIKITGSLGDITFTEDGVVKLKSGLDKGKWKNDKNMANSRQAASEFGGASKCSGAIIRAIPTPYRPLARKMAHNHLGKLLWQNARCEDFEGRKLYDFESTLPVMHRLDLSKAQHLSQRLTLHTKGHPLCPSELHINGLRDIADAIPALRHHEIQLKMHFIFLVFPEVRLEEDAKDWRLIQPANHHLAPSSAWISPEWIPEEGLRIALKNPEPNFGTCLFVAIEWRYKTTNRRVRKPSTEIDLTEFGLVKVAACFRPVNALDQPVPPYMCQTQRRKFRLVKKRARPKFQVILTPEMQLRRAQPRTSFVNPKESRNNNIRFLPPKRPKAG